jgi:hypothetical protein
MTQTIDHRLQSNEKRPGDQECWMYSSQRIGPAVSTQELLLEHLQHIGPAGIINFPKAQQSGRPGRLRTDGRCAACLLPSSRYEYDTFSDSAKDDG